jgi:hypothetical protein
VRSAALLLAALLGASRPAAAGDDEKRLLGFEEEEYARLAQAVKLTRKEARTKEGKAYVAWEHPGGIQALGQWRLYPGRASQGDYAMGISLVVPEQLEIVYAGSRFRVPEEPQAYYTLLNNNWAPPNGAMLHTCGVFRRIFPADWSGYDLLRVDAYGEEVVQTVRLLLEDEEIGPPVARNIALQPGKWATLEVDLRAAERERGLDLKRMATLTIGVARLEGKPKPGLPYTALIDNVRLSRRGVRAALPVVQDPTSHRLPDYYRAASRPQPEVLPPDPPDLSPIPPEKPIVIPTEKPALVAPVGWAAAYDSRHLLVGFNLGNTASTAQVQVLQSADGGRTWRGLDGGEKPTGIHLNNLDHGSGRGDVVGRRADVVVFSNLGCRGPSFASLRLFARKLTFTGKGWELRDVPDLVDCDLRHCNSNQSVVRTSDGRLWAGYGFVGRLGTNLVNVRCSDDDGRTWRGWAEGKSGAVPGTVHSDAKGVGFGYTFEEPCLVPFGPGVACLWQERIGYEYGKLKWSRFDGTAWSPVEEIPQPRKAAVNPVGRPPLHAVSLGGREVFLAGALFPGVLHYRDGRWETELPEAPVGGRLSVAGDRAVVLVAPVHAGGSPARGPVVLRSWRRPAGGAWSAPADLAQEEQPLSHKHDNIYVTRLGLVVQPYAPAHFVPVAWTCEGQKWVKFLRVPAP